MRVFLSIIALVFSMSLLEAAQKSSSSGGLGFSCDVNKLDCQCTGDWEGADCKAMRKNCDPNEGSHCIGDTCYCPMKPVASKNPKSRDTKTGRKGN